MFFINADYVVIEQFTENIWLHILFWLCHLSALIVIQATLFSLFARKLIQSFRIRFGLHREVYIIKGSDKYAIMLGENIATNDKPDKRPIANRLVVFLIEAEDDDIKKMNDRISHFGGIAKALDRKDTLQYYLKKARLGARLQGRKKYNIIFMPNTSVPDDVYLVAEYARKNNVNKEALDIFALTTSEWDKERMESFIKEEKRKYPCVFHIINEVDLLIRQMTETHPPFKCAGLKFNEFGVAERNFNIIILGFGTMGQQALLRLIMNGQFVTRDGSRMHATVVDREIEHLEEHFRHSYPSLGLCCEIEFKDYDVRGKVSFEWLKRCNDLDYIVVALNSNEENKKIALDIRRHYKRKGLALPVIAVSEKGEGPHIVKHDNKIFTFGCQEEIYKESIIIDEETSRMAKTVNSVYGGQPWHELDWFLQESNRASADFIPAMLKLANLTEEKAESEGRLAHDDDHIEVLAQTEQLRWVAFHAVMGYSPISIEEMRRRFETYGGEKNSRNHLDYCRRDTELRLHVCLSPWDKLDSVSEAYRELARQAGDEKEQNRDFKKNDRDIIKNIPKFLRKTKNRG